MAKLTSMLQQRFLKKGKPKMAELAEKTGGGDMTVFSGIFKITELKEQDKAALSDILENYGEGDLGDDLQQLVAITSEVKAIQNQAAMLHGERIKRAQTLLKRYREGAFTAWLIATYGNRQTPYNFLQYFEFYSKMPKALHATIETMPRQAVYTLASRDGELTKKEEIVRSYKGETKQELIGHIRATFPLDENDKRREIMGDGVVKLLQKTLTATKRARKELTDKHKKNILYLMEQIQKELK